MSQIGKPPCDEGVILGGAWPERCTAATRRWVLIAAIVGSSMAFIDGTVVNVALPAIQRDFQATAFDAQWVVESYALFLASLLLVGGVLGDHFGRRRVFMVGVVLFALASIACALSRDVHQLILTRAVQGVGGALLVPGSLALVSASFPERERGRAIGLWSGFTGITSALGPVLGGALVDHYSWVWAFLINVPLAAVVLSIAALRVPESRGAAASASLDVGGAVLGTVGLGGLVYAFIEAPSRHFRSAVVLGALGVGVAALLSFVAVELRVRSPMLPLSLLRIRNFAGANLLTLLLYAGLGGGLYFVPLNLIQVQGYSATAAGAALLPFVLLVFLLSRWAGRLVDRVGPKLPLIVGPLVAALGFALFARPGVGVAYWSGFFPAVMALGLGMAITVAPLTTTVMNSVGPELAGMASGINNAVSRTAALLAIAVFGLIMAWVFEARLNAALEAAGTAPDVVAFMHAQTPKLAGATPPPGVGAAEASMLRRAVGEAFIAGFRWIMAACASLAVLSAISAWRMIESPRAEGEARARTIHVDRAGAR